MFPKAETRGVIMGDLASWQKFLKIFSILYIIIDIAFIAAGFLVATMVIDADTFTDVFEIPAGIIPTDNVSATMAILGGAMVVAYLINLVCACFAYRGAKNPSKMKPGMILYGVLSVLGLINLVSSFASNGSVFTVFCQCILVWIVFYGTVKVYKLAK